MTKNKLIVMLFMGAFLSIVSCKKIQENKIIKDTWLVTKVKSEAILLENSMELLLPGYESNSECCKYYVDFFEDGTATGTYYKDNAIVQVDSGFWRLDKFNVQYIQIGKYINAVWDIEKIEKKKYQLTSDNNEAKLIASQPPIVSKTVMDITRLKE